MRCLEQSAARNQPSIWELRSSHQRWLAGKLLEQAMIVGGQARRWRWRPMSYLACGGSGMDILALRFAGQVLPSQLKGLVRRMLTGRGLRNEWSCCRGPEVCHSPCRLHGTSVPVIRCRAILVALEAFAPQAICAPVAETDCVPYHQSWFAKGLALCGWEERPSHRSGYDRGPNARCGARFTRRRAAMSGRLPNCDLTLM